MRFEYQVFPNMYQIREIQVLPFLEKLWTVSKQFCEKSQQYLLVWKLIFPMQTN